MIYGLNKLQWINVTIKGNILITIQPILYMSKFLTMGKEVNMGKRRNSDYWNN